MGRPGQAQKTRLPGKLFRPPIQHVKFALALLVSENRFDRNAELHKRVPSYGTTGRRYVDLIRRLARERGARHILDYGCGKRDLAAALGREFEVRDFDPALPGLDASPAPADLVAFIDVLEHVEPDFLENVLDHLEHYFRLMKVEIPPSENGLLVIAEPYGDCQAPTR